MRTGDLLKESPHRAPGRPVAGIRPQITDAELVTLAVMQAVLGFTSEARWLRYARSHLRGMFPRLPQQPGYNKRLRALAATMSWLIAALARDTSVWSDDVWIADSTPVECGRSRETARRSELAGWAEYGYCASHSRYFWGLRLHLLTTLHGLPIGFALTGARADERQVLLGILDEPALSAGRTGQIIIADKHYYGREFEAALADDGYCLCGPPAKASRNAPGPGSSSRWPGHRVRQRHIQRPARPGTPRRPHSRRGHDQGPAAHPGPDRRDLAQRPHRPARQALTRCL